jgi:Uncharacterized protein conserved in archaea
VTQWVEEQTGGRDRGPVALARAWAEVLVRPRRFFETGVTPNDQVPGLVFAALVVLVEEVVRLVVLPNAYPSNPLVAAVALGAVVVIVTPAALHIAAAAATIVLVPLAPDRAGVPETVQVIAYATAPCVFAAVPVLEVRALAVTYGAVLTVVGLSVVHRTTPVRAALAAMVPAAIAFAYGFRGVDAVGTLLRRWYII